MAWLFCLAAAGRLWAWPCIGFAEGFGPFPVRNFQPVQLLFLGMPGDRATVLKKGALDVRVELADTAMIANEGNARSGAVMKLETLRSGLFLRYGVTERFEVAMEVPVLYRYQGILNGAITTTERATTGLAGPRKDLQNLGYAYTVNLNGRSAFHGGQDQVGLGDMSLMGKYQFVQQTERLPAVSFRWALKAPTGNADHVFGSGNPDIGIGLALEKTFLSRWIAYVNVNGVFPMGHVSGLNPQPIMSAVTTVEYLWSDNLSLTTHFDYYSSPFHGTGLKVLDRDVTEFVLGFSYQLRPHLLWQVYGIENLDLVTGGAADFTLSTVVTYHLGS